MKIAVREASIEDARLIADLTRKSWAGKCPPTAQGHRDTWVNVNEDLHNGGAFILSVDDKPAGSLRWAPLDEDDHIWKIRRLGLIPAFCGKKLSQHLIEAIFHHAQLCEINELRLYLHLYLEPLTSLYEAYGFELAPEIEFSTRNTLEPPPIMMRKVLDI